METANIVKEMSITPASNKHLYTLTKLTQRYFPYAGFSYDEIIRRFKDENTFYLIANFQDKTVGFVDFTIKENNSVQLLGLAVLEEYRRLGIGRMLIKAMIEKLKKIEMEKNLKVRKIELMVAQDNYPARKLYLEFGFVKKGVLKKKIFDKDIAIFVKEY